MFLTISFTELGNALLCFFLLWSKTTSIWLKQRPANNEQPFASIVYTAVEQGRVALPCDISPPAVNDSVALVLWYKDESTQPIYMLDARRGSLKEAHQISGPQLEYRSHFHMINRPAFLQIDPVRKDDGGTYRCRVDYHRGRSINTVIKLQVVEPPSEVVILDEKNQRLSGIIGPYNEGHSLTLTCQSLGGKPRPTVSWLKDNSLLDKDYIFLPDKTVENVLNIPKLWRHDLLTNLTCQSSNNNVTVPVSSSVSIDLNLKPEKIKIEPFKVPLAIETEVEFMCIATGARPAASISWWLGNRRLQSTTNSYSGSCLLTYTPSTEDNGKYFSCKAENPRIPGSTIETGWSLTVNYPPQLVLRQDNIDVQEGEDVNFECNVRANPPTAKISWEFEGQELNLSPAAAVATINDQTLTLQKVNRSNRGRYKCSASNTEGLGVSNEIFLKVKYGPTCQLQRKSYGVAIGETVQVKCALDADPPDITFHWRLITSTSQVDDIIYKSDQSESIATYTPKTKDDYGILECWGTNKMGVQKERCSFSIVSAGPPDHVNNCSVLNQSEHTVFIQCLKGYDGGITQHFTIEAYNLDSGKLLAIISLSTEPEFFVTDLPADMAVRFQVTASNARGRSSPVVLVAHTPRSPEKLTVRDDDDNSAVITPMVMVLVVVATVLMVVIVASIIIIKIRKKRARQVDHQQEKKDEMSDISYNKDVDIASGQNDMGPDIIPDKLIARVFCEGILGTEEQCLQLTSSEERAYSKISSQAEASDDRILSDRSHVNETAPPNLNPKFIKPDDSMNLQSSLYISRQFYQPPLEVMRKGPDQSGPSGEIVLSNNRQESTV
ncbi:protein turtle homolog B-like [Tachypleus tridentatus]|uniref:protein turtle homolog B-like n=1 Tax=Tachypleus tridentatus TaxID=6853 RepID=UPI003FD0C72B